MTAAYCGEYGCGDVELTLVTPEPEPLGVFGPAASAAVRRLLQERGITLPVKQGGLAAQQADAVAETIAASVGADVDPRPFRPVLRGVLLTGGSPSYLRADMQGAWSQTTAVSDQALWWPPDKLAARYLAPYLSRQDGRAFDVMPQGGRTARAASAAELTDLPLTS